MRKISYTNEDMKNISQFFAATIIILLISGLIPASLTMPNRSYTTEAQTIDETERAKLQAELAQLEAEIAEQERILVEQKKNTGKISGEVTKLALEIRKKQDQIRNKNIEISKLSSQIKNKESNILTLDQKISRHQESLSQILRKQYQLSSYSIVEVMLSNETISEFFIDADDFTAIKGSMEESLKEIRKSKDKVNKEKLTLEERKIAEANVKAELDLARQRVQTQEKDQKYLLEQSKTKEKTYAEILADKQKKAASIRAALFTFSDISNTKIPFGEAYEYAKAASDRTGVRPAFILATLAQETGYRDNTFGRNVGQCFLVNHDTGAGVNSKGKPMENVMKPDRDVQPFIKITKRLGLDPAKTPVSCPLSYGYGGAMGIAQFIPSTWEIFASKIATIVGAPVASPWIPEHGIAAAAAYLDQLGADKGTYNSELEASCRYFSGRSCSNPNVNNVGYAKSVQNHAKRIQADIDFLESL